MYNNFPKNLYVYNYTYSEIEYKILIEFDRQVYRSIGDKLHVGLEEKVQGAGGKIVAKMLNAGIRCGAVDRPKSI